MEVLPHPQACLFCTSCGALLAPPQSRFPVVFGPRHSFTYCLCSPACIPNQSLAGDGIVLPDLLPILSRSPVSRSELDVLRKFGCWCMVGGTYPQDVECMEQTPK